MHVRAIASVKCLYMQPIDYGNSLASIRQCPVVTGCGHSRLAATVDCSSKTLTI